MVSPAQSPTPPAAVPRPRRRSWRRDLALVGFASLSGLVASLLLGAPAPGDRSRGLCESLRAEGLHAAAEDVVWIDGPPGLWGSLFGTTRAAVRASPGEGEPADIYLVEARLTPKGALIHVGGYHNLSETTGADESTPILRGDHLAYVSKSLLPGAPTTINVLDLAGQSDALVDPTWTWMMRGQHRITNYQETGQLAGIGRRVLVVDGASDVRLEVGEAGLRVDIGDRHAEIPFEGEVAADAASWLRVEAQELAPPGSLVTWAVDRVRAIPWIGDTGMQAIKQVAFTALDFVLRHKEELTGDTGAEGIAEDLGTSQLAPPSQQVPVDPDLGWPPPPLEPWVLPSLPGEGEWTAREDELFYRKNPGLPAPFVTTFIRSDRSRKATRVYVTMWDPRQVELHMMAGRVEPKSATGKAGPGLIPRTPEVMTRLVAASNAGFQALHGEYGMMAEGTVYLPPKPFAATVAKLSDGSTAFGTWPRDPTVPDEVRSYRQNMTVMVQDEAFNPYGRTWWGGTVPGAEDKTHTVRTGICLTREHFVAYFYGADLSPMALAQSMIQARCKYGIALDMNAGHSGLEFYRVDRAEVLPPLGADLVRQLDFEGEVPEMEGWSFRRRGLIRGMGLMYPPRYIKREARDFFYMTLRHVLPGDPLAALVPSAAEAEGQWQVKGLPQHGFPYALATTSVRPDASKPDRVARVLKLDPRALRQGDAAAAPPSSDAPGAEVGALVALLDAGPYQDGEGVLSVWHHATTFAIGERPPYEGSVRVATGRSAAATTEGFAAVGVEDESGMLVYVTWDDAPRGRRPTKGPDPGGDAGAEGTAVAAAADASALLALLEKMGCSQRVALAHPIDLALGGDTDLRGAAVFAPKGRDVVRFVRAEAPGGRRILVDTPVVSMKEWYPLHQHRVRYFKKTETAASDEPAGGDE